MLKAYNTIVSEFGKDAADKLFITNGQCVIENKDLMVDSPAKKKKNFFISLFSFN